MGFENMYGGARLVKEERNENDHYPTHPFATYALLQHTGVPQSIWEPAAGRGWMAWELLRNKREVLATDLHAYENKLCGIASPHDFLTQDLPYIPGFETPAIVTNPPYGRRLAQKFIEHALKKHPYIAVLCRLTFAESEQRYNLFKKNPPSYQLIFSGRFSCDETRWHTKKEATSGMVAYAWWIWDRRDRKTYGQYTYTSWINTNQMYDAWDRSLTSDQKEEFFNALPKKELNVTSIFDGDFDDGITPDGSNDEDN